LLSLPAEKKESEENRRTWLILYAIDVETEVEKGKEPNAAVPEREAARDQRSHLPRFTEKRGHI